MSIKSLWSSRKYKTGLDQENYEKFTLFLVLWVFSHGNRTIHQISPTTEKIFSSNPASLKRVAFSTKEGFFIPVFHCFGLFIAYVPLLKLGTFWVLGLMALYMLSQCCWLAHLSVTKAIPPHVTRTNHSGNSRFVTHSVTRTSLTMPALIEGYWRMPQSSNTVCSLRFSQCHSEKPHLLLKLSSRYCWNIWKNIFFPPKKVLLA